MIWPFQAEVYLERCTLGCGHLRGVSHVVMVGVFWFFFAADMVCVQGNEVGNHSVFSINSNHKATEA